MEKRCSKCNKVKDESLFYKHKSSKGGYNSQCKDCHSLYWKKPKEKIKDGFKRCTKCGTVKEIEKFTKKSTLKSGIRSSCKECDKIYRRKRLKTSEHIKWRKNYLEKNSDIIKKQRKEYFENNKEKIYDRKRKYKEENPHIFAWKNILRNSLRRMNTNKEKHTIELLGYSAEDLKQNLKLKFTDGMTWKNYGEWHIDHQKPISAFCKNTPVSIVNALSNLKPMWATTREINGILYEGNLNKSNRFM